MKKVRFMTMISLLVTLILSGCNQLQEKFSVNEQKIIEFANRLVEKEYNVKINQKEYAYSVGKQISESEFVSIEGLTAEEAAKSPIISVSALHKNGRKAGEIASYSIIYDTDKEKLIYASVEE